MVAGKAILMFKLILIVMLATGTNMEFHFNRLESHTACIAKRNEIVKDLKAKFSGQIISVSSACKGYLET